tara:strand:+ start:31258 stop:32619 length:1362 start_codon:yes stop_codon:yes gene_type:complete
LVKEKKMNQMVNLKMEEFVLHGPGGTRALDRRLFSDPDLFEQEFPLIWEKIWVFLGHESQVKNPRDYFTTWIGRVPVIVNRNDEGKIGCLVNICTHRGSTLCRKIKGSTADFACSFHGWTYDLDGNLRSAVSESRAGFPEGFDKSTRGLRRVRVENYRGFIFGTLNEEAEPLSDHLAETKTFIDLIVDQSPQGVEVLKGCSTYTYEGNWKSAAENGLDGFHVNAVHGNYVATVKNRMERKSTSKKIETRNVGGIAKSAGGFYDLGKGHAILWSEWPNPEASPLWSRHEELETQMGKVRADWATGYLRNMLIYPNVFLMDQMSTQIRVIRPLSVDKTEVMIYCFAPVGEDRESRSKRLRQYEDFFNASGMATPDDLSEFNASHQGYKNHRIVRWSDVSRGAGHEIEGPDERATALGLKPLRSGVKLEDEGIVLPQHTRWTELMAAAISGDDNAG